jgi:hypothetical protein
MTDEILTEDAIEQILDDRLPGEDREDALWRHAITDAVNMHAVSREDLEYEAASAPYLLIPDDEDLWQRLQKVAKRLAEVPETTRIRKEAMRLWDTGAVDSTQWGQFDIWGIAYDLKPTPKGYEYVELSRGFHGGVAALYRSTSKEDVYRQVEYVYDEKPAAGRARIYELHIGEED